MSNYYNYQIGVFFAILIAGLVLLFLFVAAIYFGCVITMRPEKKKRYSPPNSVRAAPQRQWQTTEHTATPYTNLYTSRATPTEYVPANSPLVQQSPAAVNPVQTPLSQPRELGVEQAYRPDTAQYFQEQYVGSEPIQTTTTTTNWQSIQPIQQVQMEPAAVAAAVGYSPVSVQSPNALAFQTSSV